MLCHYAKFPVLFTIMLNVVMLSVVMLSAVMLSVVAAENEVCNKNFMALLFYSRLQ